MSIVSAMGMRCARPPSTRPHPERASCRPTGASTAPPPTGAPPGHAGGSADAAQMRGGSGAGPTWPLLAGAAAEGLPRLHAAPGRHPSPVDRASKASGCPADRRRWRDDGADGNSSDGNGGGGLRRQKSTRVPGDAGDGERSHPRGRVCVGCMQAEVRPSAAPDVPAGPPPPSWVACAQAQSFASSKKQTCRYIESSPYIQFILLST